MSVAEESAVAAYGGYEYQIVVTVWVALDLVIVRETCQSIEVEPASQEDIAADLIVQPVATDAVETVIGATSEEGRVEIQIKRRSRYWSVADFLRVVETPPRCGRRGPAPRERALARLKADAQLRYVLITDAEVHPDLKVFVVEQVGSTSKATDGSLDGLSAGQAARIGVREKLVQELVEREIDDVLEQAARVPLQNVSGCRAALVERIRDRLLGRCSARLDRNELEEIIVLHGGFPPSTSDEFVPPANFEALSLRLEEPPFALVLVGAPGIGKTRVAERIVEEHRRSDRPFEIVKDPSPHEIRTRLVRPGRMLFYLEDPWGRYKLAEEAATWNDELPRLIREGRDNPDKRFLVTSRTAVLRESVDLSPQGRETQWLQRRLSASVMSITEADFDARARREIIRLGLRGATRWQRDWVEDRLGDIVAKMTVPHALSTFAHAVRSTPIAAELRLDQLVADSQVAAIGDVVKQQVRNLGAVVAGVSLWAFLSVGERLTAPVVQELAMWIGEITNGSADLPRLIEHLTANGWLTAPDGIITAHPTVIEGMERLVDEESTSCNHVLQALFSVLVREGRMEILARLLRGLSGRNLPIPPVVRGAIEDHLRDAVLAANDSQLVPAMESLARISTANDPVLLLARALGASETRHGFVGWSPPAWMGPERTAVSGSPEAEQLARRYIKTGLSSRTSLLRQEVLVDFLWSLGWDLSEDFTSAAVAALRRGEFVEGAIHGALAAAAPAWESLLDVALAEHDDVERWFSETGSKEQRKAEEGELDAAYSAHVIDEPSERFAPSTSALQKIVSARRAREGHSWLMNHLRRETLVRSWAEAIPYDSGESVRDELCALIEVAEAYTRPDVWQAIGRSRCLSITPLLQERIVSGPVDELTAVWGALFGMYDPEQLAEMIRPVLASVEWPRRAAIVFAVRNARMPDRHDHMYREVEKHQSCVRDLLTPMERMALDLCSDAVTSKDDPIPESGIDADLFDVIAAVVHGPHELLAAGATLILAGSDRPVQPAIQRLLSSDDEWVRLHALRAINRIKPLDRAALSRALVDPYYQCRRYAIFALSEDSSTEERTRIIAMSADPSAPVREACARTIGLQQWSDGLETLYTLLNDDRDRNEGDSFIDSTPHYHVARQAAHALGRIPPPLPEPILASLLQFLRKGRDACADIVVHSELLAIVGPHRDPALAPMIQRLLQSSWRMGDEKGSFPLRYAAAWSWVDHLLPFGEDAPLLDPAVLVEAAEHTDGRLAAPALLALGIAWKHTPEHVRRLLASDGLDEERHLLVEVGAYLVGAPIPEDMFSRQLLPSHPGRRLIAWCWEALEVDDLWRTRLDADADVQSWLETIRASSPINAALRAALLQSPRKGLLTMISKDDFRGDELTRGIPIISSFYFAGLE